MTVPRLSVRALALAATLCLAACASNPSQCVPGDLIQCRCERDGAPAEYGYRACRANGSFDEAPCQCIAGLRPDAGPPAVARCRTQVPADASADADTAPVSDAHAGDDAANGAPDAGAAACDAGGK